MVLIFGGACQGKLAYAKKEYGGRVFSCCDERIDYTADIICGLEKFVLACFDNDKEAADVLKEHAAELKNKVIICEDISCGIVPVDARLRAWREMTGRTLTRLSADADTVIRMFCGIPQVLK